MEASERLDDVVEPERAVRLIARAMDQAGRVVTKLEMLASAALAQIMVRKDASAKPTTVTLIGYMQQAWRSFARSIGMISNMQTQEIAEDAADQAVRDALPDFLTSGTLVNEWVTLLDERVRGNPSGLYASSKFDHWSAHGQRVKVSEAFTVSGELLRFPGDQARGASLGNVINCRCALRRIWIKPDGTEEIVDDRRLNPHYPARTPRKPGANPNAFTRTRPTPSFTFGYGKGPWRGAIVLGNGQRANYTVRNGGVTIRVGGKPVASAPIKRDALGNWTLGNVTTTQPYSNAGIEQMLRASVEASNRLPR